MVLDDYRRLVGTIAGVLTVLQIFSPAFICKDIIQRGSTDNIDVMPFIGGMVISILLLQNGILIHDPASIYVNIFGFVLNAVYTFIYYKYTENTGKLYMTLLKATTFVALLIGYVNQETKELVEFRFGLIITVLLLLLIGSPLLNTGEIIRTKDASSIPMPLVISGTFVTLSWLLYGIIIHNTFMTIQNIIALPLSVVQIVLYIMYPPKKRQKTPKLDAYKNKGD